MAAKQNRKEICTGMISWHGKITLFIVGISGTGPYKTNLPLTNNLWNGYQADF